jgi:hypothetical protein
MVCGLSEGKSAKKSQKLVNNQYYSSVARYDPSDLGDVRLPKNLRPRSLAANPFLVGSRLPFVQMMGQRQRNAVP